MNVKLRTPTAVPQWSESYDGTLEGILKLQSQIAQSVAKQLKGVLGVEETASLAKAETNSTEAYELYLQGRKLWSRRSSEGFSKALKLYQQAVELDDQFALAYVGIADTYLLEPYYNISHPNDSIPKAKLAAEKALSIQPNSGEALANLAMYDPSMILPLQKRCFKTIRSNPNHPTTYHWLPFYCVRTNTKMQ